MERASRRKKPIGPPRPDPVPPLVQGQECQIVFGHNTDVRKVLMMFSGAVSSLIFSPEDAEDVAAKLQHYAKAARGEKVN